MEQGTALNSGYMLATDGDRRMMYEMIRLGVWQSLTAISLPNLTGSDEKLFIIHLSQSRHQILSSYRSQNYVEIEGRFLNFFVIQP